jgi:hypothetical protein
MSRTENTKKSNRKPPSWFKRLRRQADRAKNTQALREGKDPDHRPRNDQWDWT